MVNNEEYTNNKSSRRETERILAKRDKEKYLRELNELRRKEASDWGWLVWSVGFLIVDLLLLWGLEYWSTLHLLEGGGRAASWYWSNRKLMYFVERAPLVLSLLNITWRAYSIYSARKQSVKIKDEIDRAERELSREF